MERDYEEIDTTKKEEVIDTTEKKEEASNSAFDYQGPVDENEKDRWSDVSNDLFDESKYESTEGIKFNKAMYTLLTKKVMNSDLKEFFVAHNGDLQGMGCDSDETHSKKDRFVTSVKGLMRNIGTRDYPEVLGYTKLKNNYNDLGFAGALAITYLGLTFDDDFTIDYVKECLEDMATSEDLQEEVLKDFYSGLGISRENRKKTPATQNAIYEREKNGKSAQQLLERKLELAEELGPFGGADKRNSDTAKASYVLLKEYHNKKGVLAFLAHPINFFVERNLLKEMKNALKNKLGLTDAEVNALNKNNTPLHTDGINIATSIYNNDPYALNNVTFLTSEASNRITMMDVIKKRITKSFEDDLTFENIYGYHPEEDIHPESNISDTDIKRDPFTEKLLNDRPVSVHEEHAYLEEYYHGVQVDESGNPILDSEGRQKIVIDDDELYEDNNQKEYNMEALSEEKLENIIDRYGNK